MTDYKSQLTTFIKQELLHGRAVALDDEKDLLNAGVIDSLGILRLVAFMEEEVGIQVPDEDVVFENFESIKAIVGYIERRKGSTPSMPA